MNDSPIVSVVVPCRNRAHLLAPTIESILGQDYPNIECIVVDAASTDGTVEILKSYGKRIKWVSEPDEGHAAAINKGWRMSSGEILAWLNADDVWDVPCAVGRAVEYLRTHRNADVVYGDCGQIDAAGNVVGTTYLRRWDLEYAVLHCDHCIPQPASFLRREIVERVGFLDEDFNDSKKDHELWLRIGLVGNIHHLPQLLAHERNTPGYMSRHGDVTALACVRLTRKFFSLPNVPDRIRRQQRRAMSNAYIKGVDYAFYDGRHWSTIIKYTLKAMATDRSNARCAGRRAKQYLELGAQENALCRALITAYALLNAPRVAWMQSRTSLAGLYGRQRKPGRTGDSPKQNLLGARDVESAWIASHIPCGAGEALFIGSAQSHLALVAAQRGFNVTTVHARPGFLPYVHERLRLQPGDIVSTSLPLQSFDLILNCASLQDLGAGGGDVTGDGDLEAAARLRSLMKPDGVMLLTIPIGRDAIFPPLCRVYGKDRLPRLLEGYVVETEEFWVKDNENRWVLGTKETALDFPASAGSWDPLQNVTALGCFVLRKSL